jgi:hypothetical protein
VVACTRCHVLREKEVKMSTFMLQEMWGIRVSSVTIVDPVI